MGMIWNNCNNSLQLSFIQSTVLLLLMATFAHTRPLHSKGVGGDENEMERLTDSEVKNEMLSERQRTLLKSLQRLLTKRTTDNSDGMSPDESSFQKYYRPSDSFPKNGLNYFFKDYQRNIQWYRNSRILKREARQDSGLLEELSPSHYPKRSESISPSRFAGRRHIRHSRRRFREKSERSGWGGGYG